jgi:uncharacterized repeat protein (TIGR02543 family)
MSITKKRISAIIFAIILLITTAMIPTMKVSAAPSALPTRDQQAAMDKLCDVTQVDVDVAALQGGGDGMNFIGTDADIDYIPQSYTADNPAWTQDATTWEIGGDITLTVDGVEVPGEYEASGTVTMLGEAPWFSMSGTATFSAFNAVFTVPEIEVTVGGTPPLATAYSFKNISLTFASPYIMVVNADGASNFGEFMNALALTGIDKGKITIGTPIKDGYTFDGWFLDEAYTIPFDPSKRYFMEVILYAKFTKNPEPTPDYSGSSSSGSTGSSEIPAIPEIKKPTETPRDLETESPGTLSPGGSEIIEMATPAADVTVDSEISEEGTMTLTIGGTKVETASTSAATVIAAGEASEVITSGNAVAVITTDGAVIAGANATGSMNSTSTVAALTAAAASAELGDEVKIAAGDDVSVISAATINKLLAAAEEAGVDAVIAAAATDETGAEIGEIDIPITGNTKTSIKTGLILEDETIDAAVAEREKLSGNTVLASFKTEQKTSFGTKVTFSFDTETLGLDGAADGDTYYVAIKRGDGKTVQVKATIVEGKLVFTTASAGVMMISNEKFTK